MNIPDYMTRHLVMDLEKQKSNHNRFTVFLIPI